MMINDSTAISHMNVMVGSNSTAASYEFYIGNIMVEPMHSSKTGNGEYIPDGCIGIICSNGNTTYLDLQGNELHGLDETYRDILRIDANGHAVIEKRVQKIILDGSVALGGIGYSGNSTTLPAF
jgi:hypothetical protein